MVPILFALVLYALIAPEASAGLIWPAENASEPRRIDRSSLTIEAVAFADSATLVQLEVSDDLARWWTVATDTATAGNPARFNVPSTKHAWFRTSSSPLGVLESYSAVAPYDVSVFSWQLGGQQYSRASKDGVALSYPDPSMTTTTSVHTFRAWLHVSPADSVSMDLWIESPFVDDGSDPAVATLRDNTNRGDADSCGVDWWQIGVVGNGPVGTFPDSAGVGADSAVVAPRDIVTLAVTWASQSAAPAGGCSYRFSIEPPAGWFVVSGMDEPIVISEGHTVSGGIVAQYRAPASLSDPVTYLGCFRVPRDVGSPPSNEGNCADPNWGNIATYGAGSALAFRPDGDPAGPNDGFPGSLFLTLREGVEDCWANSGKVGEIGIPIPRRSFNKDSVEVATALGNVGQPQGSFWTSAPMGDYQRQGGLFYLDAQGDQTTPKLYQSMYDYYTNNTDRAVHTWAEVDLDAPDTRGPWHIGTTSPGAGDETSLWHYRKNCAYAFAVPDSFRLNHLDDDYRIAVGFSSREAGTQGSNQGPSATAFGPWTAGNPPAANTDIPGQLLLVYPRPTSTATCAAGVTSEADYSAEDRWTGAFWPSKHVDFGTDTTAVVGFVGSRCRYTTYYFKSDCVGTPGCPDNAHGDQCCAHRLCPDESCPGYICGDDTNPAPSRRPTIAFYAETDLARVADGLDDPWTPQPIAEIDLSGFLVPECSFGPAGVAWDDANGLLYVAQNGVWASSASNPPRVAIHVFRLTLVDGT